MADGVPDMYVCTRLTTLGTDIPLCKSRASESFSYFNPIVFPNVTIFGPRNFEFYMPIWASSLIYLQLTTQEAGMIKKILFL